MILNNLIKYFTKLIPFILSGIYTGILSYFYITKFAVPDFNLYSTFYPLHSKDSFNKIFIKIAYLLKNNILLTHVIMLFLMSIGFFNLITTFGSRIKDNFLKITLVFFIFSSSVFYYLYGKIFYEFPFIFFIWSFLIKIFYKIQDETNNSRISFLKKVFYFLMGFAFSFKAVSITALFFLGIFSFIHFYQKKIKDIKKEFIYILFFAFLGFCMGYFSIFYAPVKTLKQYFATGHYSDNLFYFTKNEIRPVWDHVLFGTFQYMIMSIYSIILMFLIFIFIKDKKFTFLFFFSCISYVIFHKSLLYFSANSHCFAMFIVTFYCITIAEKQEYIKNNILLKILIFLLTATTFYYNFFFHVSRQYKFHSITKKNVQWLQENQEKILANIKQTIPNWKEFFITANNKRYVISKKTKKLSYILECDNCVPYVLWIYPSQIKQYIIIQNKEFENFLQTSGLISEKQTCQGKEIIIDKGLYNLIICNKFSS